MAQLYPQELAFVHPAFKGFQQCLDVLYGLEVDATDNTVRSSSTTMRPRVRCRRDASIGRSLATATSPHYTLLLSVLMS
jgi:hypothetical protein